MAKICWSCCGDGVEVRLDMVEGVKEWDYASSAGMCEVAPVRNKWRLCFCD